MFTEFFQHLWFGSYTLLQNLEKALKKRAKRVTNLTDGGGAMLQLVLLLLHITPSTSDFGAIGSSSLGWLADELDDPSSRTLSSTFTDTSVFDFEIPFYSTGAIHLGLHFDSNLIVQRIDDSKAADTRFAAPTHTHMHTSIYECVPA